MLIQKCWKGSYSLLMLSVFLWTLMHASVSAFATLGMFMDLLNQTTRALIQRQFMYHLYIILTSLVYKPTLGIVHTQYTFTK